MAAFPAPTTLSHASSISTSAPPRRASATPPLRGKRSNAANSERSEQRAGGTRLWLAPHRQCRRYWLCGVAIITEAIVCRRYTIMVAQIHHLKPHHKTPPQNPSKKPHHKTPPKNPTKKPHQKSLSTTLPLSRTSGTLLAPLAVGGIAPLAVWRHCSARGWRHCSARGVRRC